MTSPFNSTSGAAAGGDAEYTSLGDPGVANEVGIFFVNWRKEHWPTSYTQPGKQAECVGVDFVNLNTGQVVRDIRVRQVYIIRALKAAGVGNMAIGRVAYTERTRSDPPKYEWEDFSGNQQVVQRGIGWLEGPGQGFQRSPEPQMAALPQQGGGQQWGGNGGGSQWGGQQQGGNQWGSGGQHVHRAGMNHTPA